MEDIKEINAGPIGKVFQRYKKKLIGKEHLCLNIVTKYRSLDLMFESSEERNQFVDFIKIYNQLI